MTRAQEKDGNLEYHLTCPVCEWEGIIYYTRKPPDYCSDACKQKAYRQRKRNKLLAQGVTLSKRRRQNNTVKTAYLEHQVARYLVHNQADKAQAVYDLGLAIGAPLVWTDIKKIEAQMRQR